MGFIKYGDIPELDKEEAKKLYISNPAKFYNERIHTHGDSDRICLNADWPDYYVKYHYNILECAIIDILVNFKIADKKFDVIDVGSGSGHWVEFYRSLFSNCNRIVGTDICDIPIKRLINRYWSDTLNNKLNFFVWDVSTDVSNHFNKKYDVVNAIDVLHFIIDDNKWVNALKNLSKITKEDGVIIVTEVFGYKTREWGAMRKQRSYKLWQKIADDMGMYVDNLRILDWYGGASSNQNMDNIAVLRFKDQMDKIR